MSLQSIAFDTLVNEAIVFASEPKYEPSMERLVLFAGADYMYETFAKNYFMLPIKAVTLLSPNPDMTDAVAKTFGFGMTLYFVDKLVGGKATAVDSVVRAGGISAADYLYSKFEDKYS